MLPCIALKAVLPAVCPSVRLSVTFVSHVYTRFKVLKAYVSHRMIEKSLVC